VNPDGSNGQGYTYSFFLIIIIQIPNQVVESFFFLINLEIIITKKKRIWDRIRLHYVGTTFGIECGAFTSMPSLYSRKITNQPLLEFDGNTVKKRRNSTNCFAQPLNLE
jgi:hypothetical protein